MILLYKIVSTYLLVEGEEMKNKIWVRLITIAFVTLIFNTEVFAKASNSDGGFSYLYLFLLVGFVVAGYLIYAWNINRKISVKEGAVHEALHQISQTDTTWNEEELKQEVEDNFYRVQHGINDRKYFELENILHPSLYTKWKMQLEAVDKNDTKSIDRGIENVQIVDVKNYKDNEKDVFTASIDIMGTEYLVDKKGNLIFTAKTEEVEDSTGLLVEYWTFERENDKWLLIGVNRESSWKKYINAQVVDEDASN